jgi:choline dehydrogenase
MTGGPPAVLGAWSYDDVLPYFRRSEDNERGGDDYHGAGGPLAVSDDRSSHALSRAFVDAAVQAGVSPNRDFNGADQEGVGFFQLTQRNGMRCSAATAFLSPALVRPNLTVITDALVNHVTFSGHRAIGVEFSHAGAQRTVVADREVILSAGSYETPKLLMLSGIGPGDALRSFELQVRADLPVGQGLQDHLLVFINYATDVKSLMSAGTARDVELLEREGRGALTSNLAEAGGFVHTRDGLAAPDSELLIAPVMSHQENLGVPTAHALALGPSVLAPSSRGQVTLRSLNPATAPRIQHTTSRPKRIARASRPGCGSRWTSPPSPRCATSSPARSRSRTQIPSLTCLCSPDVLD